MGSPPSSNDALLRVLHDRFGISAFKPWQREAVDAVLGHPGKALVIAPTGGGKSLTYQLPAAVLKGVTLVLSPLIALMEDQVRSLQQRGISATFIASSLDQNERQLREREVLQGKYKLVYAAPERLAYDYFVGLLERSRIALVAIDEAHCISHWGHDFRPDYLRIGTLLERLNPQRILACTATATPEVRREIVRLLGLNKTEYAEILRGFARPNLHLSAMNVDTKRETKQAVEQALRVAIGEPRKTHGASIVYAATRKSTEQWGEYIAELGYKALAYHAGMLPDVRSKVADAFSSKNVDVVVATNAFGMGIDRSDVRAVIHVQPPSSIEAYYQEVGRAGRDGRESYGLLMCSGADISIRRRLVEMGSDGAAPDPVQVARAWGLFRDLLRYVDARSCRHDFILRYFGDEHEILGGCGHCDVCEALDETDGEPESEAEKEATTLIVRKALSGVARAQRRAGLVAIAEMLCGLDNEKMKRFGFDQLTTYGLLKDRSLPWVSALMRAMLAAGWIDLTPNEHPVPYITKSGADVMKGTSMARIVLPMEPRSRKTRRKERPSPSTPSGLVVYTSGTPTPSSGPLVVSPTSSANKDRTVDLTAAQKDLFELLRGHRAEVAKKLSVPAYVVAHDKTLIEMAKKRPQTKAALLSVFGMGPSRVEQYGDGFLEVLRAL